MVRIKVAQGTYNAALGETMPIVVRGGISLEGEGPGKSIISGTALHNSPGLSGQYASLVVGHPTKINRISGFTFSNTSSSRIDPNVGIVCDQGNAMPADLAPTVPNTVLKNLLMSSDYDIGIMVTTAGPSTGGGNLRITESQVQAAATGIFAVGCDDRFPTRQNPVALEIGDGTAAGANTFQFQDPAGGFSVAIGACVTRMTVRNNTFSGVNTGINIEQPLRAQGAANHFVIDDNKFDRLRGTGLSLVGGLAVVEELKGNVFSQISTSTSPGFSGAGISIVGLKEDGIARIAYARGNSFVDNDVGVMIVSSYDYKPTFMASDFGTMGDPGANVFRCNSRPVPAVGGDVIVDLVPTGVATLPFSGNLWDHMPPTHHLWNSKVNGDDWAVSSDTSIHIADDGSSQDTTPCAAGRTR